MKPLVSILIPCYNAEAFLAETLESALSQTWENKEIIVVDDGSRDRSLTIAKQFDSRGVKVISQENRGASATRNRAYQESQGDFIQYLDADDLLAPDKIERQMQIFAEGNTDYVAAGEWAKFYQHPSEAVFEPEPFWTDLAPIEWLISLWDKPSMIHPGVWLVPRHLTETAGLWDERLSLDDDGEYFCRIVLASAGVKFCRDAKVFYRSGISGSLSVAKSTQAWKSRFLSLELCKNYLLAKEDSLSTRRACANRFQRFFYEVYPNVPEICRQAAERVKELGGSDVQPVIGPKMRPFAQIIGWRQAKKIQHFAYKYGLSSAVS
ncbi:MAG: glycosyltransferase family A protein [Oscillatoria sp. PMC 1051.18]|uniref:glycosyltransferase family 2 protein n=1 Tax=Oscillatoria salina TaxID=331517 RepID=UPI001CCA6E39|nr:glycosyltransferase family A protein [Oscillatoria salina]MBZ8180250.1 glycosyltransferase family 2 protein [Oscillatoria salina IIICB1]MEC4892999.1 glycosyltransferase family A protein [Oscillatoria sp. PMC 1050.18]MEC5029512.1 glycosyltransferase family A protein [Oscillatoria sp. PMC 1051.18]